MCFNTMFFMLLVFGQHFPGMGARCCHSLLPTGRYRPFIRKFLWAANEVSRLGGMGAWPGGYPMIGHQELMLQ